MHGDGAYNRQRLYNSLIELECPICGKVFVPAPEHIYNDGKKRVCSWHCQVEAERRKAAERAKKRHFRGKRIPPGRDDEIRKLASEGMSHEELSVRYQLCKERIRQIVTEGLYSE